MDKLEAIKRLETAYPDLTVDKIIEDPDRFIAQMNRDSEPIVGGVKAIDKLTKKVTEVNPLRIKGLVKRLMMEG